jgi:outer membrane lipoprotein-sorting protein
MIKRARFMLPMALLLVLSAAISACSAGQQVTAADVITNMRETAKTTQSAQASVDLTLDINKDGLKTLVEGMMPGQARGKGGMDWSAKLPDSVSASLNVWKQSPDKLRVEVANASIPEANGAIFVYDGQKFYAYDKANNTFYTGTPDKMADKVPGEIAALLNSADFDKELDKVLSATDIKMAGEEKVAGSDAYKLDLTPKPDAAELLGLPDAVKMQAGVLIKDAKASLWVDKTRWVPLKLTIEHPNMGKFTYEVKSLELNQPIDASKFVLQVPPDAKPVDLDAMHDQMKPKSMTITEAREAATKDGWKLLEPAYLPDNATLVGVTNLFVSEGSDPTMGGKPAKEGLSGYTLNYSSSKLDFSITQAKGEIEKGLGDDFSGVSGEGTGAHKEVTVRGVQAIAFSPDGANWTSLIWQEKDSGVWVAVRGKLSLDETLKLAEGLE